ncbi:MAG: DUF86 domain-containing protein [Candidatus Tritonobacter lacicola]|nr:DUF86 domain-containing protein [Candidatus Tritonobacter lacicola]
MSRNISLYLEDIVKSCEKVLRFTKDMSREMFLQDEKTYDAVVRNLEIVGEAAKNVPNEIREKIPNIEWRKMGGMRDILSHGYFGIDDDILWDVVRNKVPRLAEEVSQFLGKNQV